MVKTICLSLGLLCSCVVFSQKRAIYFETDQHQLTASAKHQLDSFYNAYLHYHTPRLFIRGYADSIGNSDYNFDLSDRRVNAVLSYLEIHNYPMDKVLSSPSGEAEDSTATAWKNRRVDLLVDPNYTVYDCLSQYQKQAQVFEIDNTKDTVLQGAERTNLFIPAYSFTTAEGRMVKNVQIELKEFYSQSDILFSPLTTATTNNEVLETSGMFFLGASSNGKDVRLKGGAAINVSVSQVQHFDEVRLYKGQDVNGKVLWRPKKASKPLVCAVERVDQTYKKSKENTSLRALDSLDAYLKRYMDFPQAALNRRACGRVKVRFYLDSKGHILKPRFMGRIDPSIKAHLIELFELAPPLYPSFRSDKRASKHPMTVTLRFAINECQGNAKRQQISQRDFKKMNLLFTSPKTMFIEKGGKRLDASDMLYSVRSMGWKNLDRLAKLPNRTAALAVNHEVAYNVDFKLVLKDYQVVLNGSAGDRFYFSSLPEGVEAFLIGIKFDQGKIYLMKEELTLDGSLVAEPEFKQVDAKELDKALARL